MCRLLLGDHALKHHISKKKKRISVLERIVAVPLLAMICLTTVANAHEGKGLNGGQLADNGMTHVEFIGGSGDKLLLFAISDKSQKPRSVTGAIAFAIIVLGGQQIRVPLLSEGENILGSDVGQPPKPGETVWFVARMASGETLKMKFISR